MAHFVLLSLPTLGELDQFIPAGGADYVGFFLEAFAWGVLSSAFAWLLGYAWRWMYSFFVPKNPEF